MAGEERSQKQSREIAATVKFFSARFSHHEVGIRNEKYISKFEAEVIENKARIIFSVGREAVD